MSVERELQRTSGIATERRWNVHGLSPHVALMVLETKLPVGTCINPMGLRVLLVEEDGIAGFVINLTFQLAWWPKLSISGTNVVPASTCVVEANQRQNGSGVFHHHHMDRDYPVLGHQNQDLLKVGPSTSQPISFKIYLIFKQMPNISDLQAKNENIWSSGSRNCNYTCKRGGPCKVTFGGHPRAGRPICLQRGWFGHLVIILSSWTSPLRYVKGSAVIQRTVKDDIYSWGCP